MEHLKDRWFWALLGIFLDLVLYLLGHLRAAIVLTILVILAITAFRCLVPSRKMPKDRIRSFNRRIHLRVIPGYGFMTNAGVTATSGRWAMYRRSSRIRPSLPGLVRFAYPDTHSILMGRAQLRRKIRMPLQEHIVTLAEPRTGKTQAMAKWIFRHPGAALVVSTRKDLYEMTSGIRSRRGPIATFAPQARVGLTSSIAWDLVRGCADPATCIRRAEGLAEAAQVEGTEDSNFWSSTGINVLRALLMAADIAGGDLRHVYYWSLGPTSAAEEAVRILEQAGRYEMALPLAEHVNSPAQKTTSTVKMVLAQMFGFMGDPALAACVLPAEGEGFDFPDFINRNGTLYCSGSPDGASSPMAALFSCLVMEMRYHVIQMGSCREGGRLEPPCAFFMDECTGIAPVDVPTILQDAAGFGLVVYTVAHGEAQLRNRWHDDGAQTIMDTSAYLLLPGIKASRTLEHVSDLCGTVLAREGDSWKPQPVITPAMIRSLPTGYGLLIRGSCRPVIVRLGLGYKDREYKRAVRAGVAKVALTPAITRASSPVLSPGSRISLSQHATVTAQAASSSEPEAASQHGSQVITAPDRRVRRAWDAKGGDDD